MNGVIVGKLILAFYPQFGKVSEWAEVGESRTPSQIQGGQAG